MVLTVAFLVSGMGLAACSSGRVQVKTRPVVEHLVSPVPSVTPHVTPRPPTPPPTRPPPVSHAPPPVRVARSDDSVRAQVIRYWPGDDNWVLLTVFGPTPACPTGESDGDPNDIGGTGNNYYGLFQMGPWARSHYGNPLTQSVPQQVVAAWHLIQDEGSGQWSCSPYSYHP